jgi:hypothetical protein
MCKRGFNRVNKPGALITLEGGQEVGPSCQTALNRFGNSSFDLVGSAGGSCHVDQ